MRGGRRQMTRFVEREGYGRSDRSYWADSTAKRKVLRP